MFPRIVIAGDESGCGKTTVTLGLMKTLSKKGLKIQGFKVGPDYIDPSYYHAFTGRKGRNLDLWMLSEDTVLELFVRNSGEVDISIIEGVMGLFDGAFPDDRGSTAHLARVLKAPVILVVSARGSSTSIAARVLGFKLFDPEVKIEGLILNHIGGQTHLSYVKKAIEEKTGISVLGGIPRDEGVALEERHLGLIPAVEKSDLTDKVDRIASLLEKNVDLEYLLKIAKNASPLPSFKKNLFLGEPGKSIVRIGAAQDEAFSFYYEDNFDLLKFYGCEIIPFSPMKDHRLPSNLDAIFIGGGFPEIYAFPLQENLAMKNEIKNFAISGKVIYVECGGLMYLGKILETIDREEFSMVGLFPIKTTMKPVLRALSYNEVLVEKKTCFFETGDKLRGHEFHYSELTQHGELNFSYNVSSSTGKAGIDGIYINNALASYTHIHFASNPEVVRKIAERIRSK